MTNEMTNTLPFKVKCIDGNICSLTLGKEYTVLRKEDNCYEIKSDTGHLYWYSTKRFEIVDKSSKNKQEFSIGDKVVINKISDDSVSLNDKNVKVGDVATVSMIERLTIMDIDTKEFWQSDDLRTLYPNERGR